MMKTHLDQTLAEAVDELTGHFHRGVREYGAIERHILKMADTISSGIEAQFPRRFALTHHEARRVGMRREDP